MVAATGINIQPPPGSAPAGLTSVEVRQRIAQVGPNSISEQAPSATLAFLFKFWAPVPWMLEAAAFIQLALGAYVEAAVIGGLLFFNATLGFVQEGKANAALAAILLHGDLETRVVASAGSTTRCGQIGPAQVRACG